MWGILLLALCLFSALGLFSYNWRDIGAILHEPPTQPPANLIGPVGAWLSFGLFMLFGVAAYLVPAWCLAVGLILVFDRSERSWPKAVWSLVLVLALAAACELRSDALADLRVRINVGDDTAGLFGRLVRSVFVRWMSTVGTGILVWSVFAIALVLLVGWRNLLSFFGAVWAWLLGLIDWVVSFVRERREERRKLEREEKRVERERRRLEKTLRREAQLAARAERKPPRPEPEPEPEPAPQPEPVPPPEHKREPAAPEPVLPASPDTFVAYQLPPVSLLDPLPPQTKRGVKADTATTARILIETLAEFGIEAQVMDVATGPVVTRYELLPAPGIRVERIAGLANNLALSLKATSVRVQAPIPGKGVVGIEVPNTMANLVTLREIVTSDIWEAKKAKLPLILGKDVGGNDLVADLAEMPHMLIAGATGAGKTVCMNSILAGLLMSCTPDHLRLLLVDPKIVEFSVYNHLPHLVVPVVTDPKKVAIALRWAINEMERRYKLFAKVGVRNIASYNSRTVVHQEKLFDDETGAEEPADQPPGKVPYVVVIIDELADLMLADQAEIENCVARLAQLSRAVGIHMILSTQRPSVNVITGTIKANFPARIAFQVAQRVDSRTILDTIGADKLLGRGDMLFLPPGTSKLVRAQGAMTTDAETHRIVDFIKSQGEPSYENEIREKLDKTGAQGGAGSMDGGEDDELLNQAVTIIRETGRASTSSLQRRLRIGYTRAARIMDVLEEKGVVGPPRGSDPREILVDLEETIPDNASEQTEE